VEVDLSFRDMGLMVVMKILENLDLRDGLVESLELWRGQSLHKQILDYVGVPFRCIQCHKYGHVVVDYQLPYKKKVGWKN
jgi:hypothetical protein